ncbi:MAG: hypothetical protein RL662_1742 [Bacteroidota bacterium]
MKKNKWNLFLSGILTFVLCANASAQEVDKKLDLSFILGYHLGATAPVPMPFEIVKINSVSQKFNPQIGANLVYNINNKWGVGTALTLDSKGMRAHTEVKDIYANVVLPNGVDMTGHITGRNMTEARTLYLTQPVYGTYRFDNKWQVRLGAYVAEALSRKFKGNVTNVVIKVESPISEEKDIEIATFDFSKQVHKVEMGALAGGEYRLNKHVGFYGNLTWAFSPFFSNNKPVTFTVRNIYGSLGVSYRL